MVQVDLFGPWSFEDATNTTYQIKALSAIDIATRWPEIHAYEEKTSETISLLFDREWLNRYPRPSTVIYDNGTEFTSEWTELLISYGIRPVPTTIKNPQANSYVERIHGTIANMLRTKELEKVIVDDTTIPSLMSSVAWALRTVYHSTLKSSSGQLTFGRDMVINSTYLANWHQISETRAQNTLRTNLRENAKRISHDYKVGDMVIIVVDKNARKLACPSAPKKITQVHCNGNVTLKISRAVTERINIRRIKPTW